MITVGLTGGIGSGKSTVGEIFSHLGAVIVDSDSLARQAIEPGSVGYEKVVEHFGDRIVENGAINRSALAQIIFTDEKEKKFVESIIHPYVTSTFEKIAHDAPGDSIVINQIPLLVELDAENRFDLTICITTPRQLRINRLLNRGMDEKSIVERMNNQVSDEERENYCDLTLANDSTLEALTLRAQHIWDTVLLPYSRGEITKAQIATGKRA